MSLSKTRAGVLPASNAALAPRTIWLALLLLLVARLAENILLYRAGFHALTADEFSRSVLGAQWAVQPYTIHYGAWLPLHIYVLGIVLSIHDNLLLTPQILSLALGGCAILLVYRLGTLLTGNALVGLLSAALVALNPAHVWLSAVPLSEMMYAVCSMAAICAVLSYHATSRTTVLVIAGLMLGFSNGIRYEGWFLSVLYTLYVACIALVHLRAHRLTPRDSVLVLGSLVLCWSVPAAWLVSSAIATGDPLFGIRYIPANKVRWYGAINQYENYLYTTLRLDPLILLLAPLGFVGLVRNRTRALLPYLLFALGPILIFIILHHGQLEPPGNYIRYLAPFIFVLYPLMAVALIAGTRLLRRSSRVVQSLALLVLLVGIGAWQVRTTFTFRNDPVAIGLAVGQRIAELRSLESAPTTPDVLTELTYWQYLAVHVGANDIDHILYDRDLDVENRATVSLFQTDLDAIRRCVDDGSIRYIIAATPEIKQIIERDLGLPAISSVGDYVFYDVTGASLTAPPSPCALPRLGAFSD